MSTDSPNPSPTRKLHHLVVMGLMGSGKSTVGAKLATDLDWRYSDSDEELQERTGLTGAEFAAAHGVDALHVVEAALVLMALGSNERTVVTAAGSTIENDVVRRVVQSRAAIAYLDVPVAELKQRHDLQTHRRPLTGDELEAQRARRHPLFTTIADIVISSGQPDDALKAARSLVA